MADPLPPNTSPQGPRPTAPGEPATVLIVDDEPLNVDLIEQELDAAGYRTAAARSGEEALAIAARALPELILLDVMMRGIDGYETCRRLKAAEATRSIPVIFLTALKETFDKLHAFELGAVDYVTKPFDSEELLARVGTHIALRREIEAHRRSKATIRALIEDRGRAGAMIGASPALGRVRELIARVAPTEATVLIEGETGTGKELAARAIHDASRRRDRALIVVNCAALPGELVESELFGHEKGAFTGAVAQRRGRFELADGGTVFLDEIGELPLAAQAKLLRVLQEGEFERVGGTRPLRIDVRVIAATNRNLQAEVAAGRFRQDLFYRLDVVPIVMPPLRERREDIEPLLRHFAERAARRLGRPLAGIAPAFIERALAHDWPGNIRELENLVERVLIVTSDPVLDARELLVPPATGNGTAQASADATLEQVEREHVLRTLQAVRWQIEGAGGAAQRLGLNPSTLRGRLRKLGIRKPE
jgi:DNA-binding NtrC family response regulator